MIKPDGVARNLVGEIIARFEVRFITWLPFRHTTRLMGCSTRQFLHTHPLTSITLQRKGFKLVGLKLMHASPELLAEHYQDLVRALRLSLVIYDAWVDDTRPLIDRCVPPLVIDDYAEDDI